MLRENEYRASSGLPAFAILGLVLGLVCLSGLFTVNPGQAKALAARFKIVDGAVGMVENALEMLAAKGIVVLDEERLRW